MPKFVYKARDKQGKLLEGVKFANSSREVVEELDRVGLLAVSVEEATEIVGEKEKKKKKKREVEVRKRINAKEIAIFCRQMATMINAGVSIVESIEDITQMVVNVKFRNVLKTVSTNIKRGSSLSEALKKHPRIFSRIFIAMIRAGEESGNLDIVLLDLSDYLENGVKLRRKIKSASTYPVFIGVFFAGVVAGLVLFLIPRFKKLFISMGTDLPLPTKIVMGISDLAIHNFHWLILLAGGAVAGLVFLYNTKPGRFKIDKLLLDTPIVGVFITKVILTRFFQTLATLLKSGVDVVASLEIAAKVINNIPAEQMIDNIRIKIMEGSSLAAEMANYTLFPRMPVRMTAIGEKSGKIDEMLARIAEYYSDEVDATVEGFSSIIEPVLIVFLGFIVGIFIISMYLPIFKMAIGMMSGGGGF
ncbi:MAG: type II secretion system F family protein [Elusimicrobia bacterium]|nr:type II secretion system F family protein [Elusimicrobiota bacterium]